MPRNGLLVAAEHEAAHGVCAASLGVPVVRLAVFANGGGECIRGFTTPELSAVISCAGDCWDREFSAHKYRDGACADLIRQVQLVGVGGDLAGPPRGTPDLDRAPQAGDRFGRPAV